MPERFMTDGRLRGLFYAFMVVTLSAMVMTMFALLLIVQQTNERGKDNRLIIQRLETLATSILDCTEETGLCYKRGQAATAQAVTGIGDNTYRLIVAGLSCQSDGIVDQKPLAACMVERASSIPPAS